MFGACREDLPPLFAGKFTEARAIDDAGNVAGHAYDDQNNEWAVRWRFQNGAWTIETLDGGQHAAAWGMNSAGDIVGSGCSGTTTPPCQSHSLFWPATGGKTDLGTLGGWQSAAFAINAAQEIVGWSQTSPRGTTHAFIWSPANGMRDLGTLRGDNRSEASGVNNVAADGSRQVVAFGQSSSGNQRAFVATVK